MFDSLVYAADLADLSEVWTSVVQKWVGPALIIVIGAMSLKFLFSRKWTEFISFLALGIIVAVIVYGASAFFGENGSMIKNAKNIATSVN